MQALVPPVENVEGEHDSQLFVDDDAYLPAAQYVHLDDPAVDTFPTSQTVQLLAAVPEYFPVSHATHEPLDPTLYVPAKQFWQDGAPDVAA